ITRPDGLLTMASFDEANPDLRREQIKDLIGNETLAMAQIALRPMPDGFEDTSGLAVQYFAVTVRNLAPDEPQAPILVKFDPSKITLDAGEHLLLEVIDVSHGLAGGRVVALAKTADGIEKSVWMDGRDLQATAYTIDVAGLGQKPVGGNDADP